MRRVVKPLEALLTSHKRIVLKDSAVSWLVGGGTGGVSWLVGGGMGGVSWLVGGGTGGVFIWVIGECLSVFWCVHR